MHVVGVALAVAAAVLLLLAFATLNWFDGSIITAADGGTTLRNVHDFVRIGDASGVYDARWVANAYFGWAAWVLLVLTVGAAVFGNVAAAAGHAAHGPGLVAMVLGVLGVAATFGAIDLFASTGRAGVPTYGEWISHVGPAFFCSVAGFVLAAFSGAAAARRPLPRASTAEPTPVGDAAQDDDADDSAAS